MWLRIEGWVTESAGPAVIDVVDVDADSTDDGVINVFAVGASALVAETIAVLSSIVVEATSSGTSESFPDFCFGGEVGSSSSK